jgi:hypothetical protein
MEVVKSLKAKEDLEKLWEWVILRKI